MFEPSRHAFDQQHHIIFIVVEDAFAVNVQRSALFNQLIKLDLVQFALVGNVERAQLLQRLIPLFIICVLNVPLQNRQDLYQLLESLVLLDQSD
jgi:hypothetical protein